MLAAPCVTRPFHNFRLSRDDAERSALLSAREAAALAQMGNYHG